MFSENSLQEALTPKIFNLILLPTEKCNFRCTYCYEDFKIGRMKPHIVQGIKNLLERRIPQLDSFLLSWFGGEPLLAKSIIEDIGVFSRELCKDHGVKFFSGYTTNAYLLDADTLRLLADISPAELQVTLDGDEEWHNQTRVLANQGPTFERIWDNLLAAKATSLLFKITLRLHIHRDNVESQRRLVDTLRRELLTDPRFEIFFHRVSNLGPTPIKEVELGRKEYGEALNYITGNSSEISCETSGISEDHMQGYICYAAKPNSLMVRANGRIGKCTVALSDERNDVGHINPDGTLNLVNEKLRPWFEGYSDLSAQSLGCPLSVLGELKHSSERRTAGLEIALVS